MRLELWKDGDLYSVCSTPEGANRPSVNWDRMARQLEQSGVPSTEIARAKAEFNSGQERVVIEVAPHREPEYTLTIQKVSAGYELVAFPTDTSPVMRRLLQWADFQELVCEDISKQALQELKAKVDRSNCGQSVLPSRMVFTRAKVDTLKLK